MNNSRLANLRWYIGGAALVGILTVLLLPALRKEDSAPAGPPAPSAGAPPPLSANMRENADRLFNRVMRAQESGDTADMKQFAPMAIAAYENSGPLDADGLFHLSVLQLVGGNPDAARRTANQILQNTPTHLLGLSAAASAAMVQRDSPAARKYYQLLLAALPAERARQLPEYQDHAQMLIASETEARRVLGARPQDN